MTHPVERVSILGVKISAVEPATVLSILAHWIEAGERQYVCVCAVHIVMECQEDSTLRAMVNGAGLVVPDGMPLAWAVRLAGQGHVRRVYGPDLMLSFCRLAASRGYRSYLLGGAPGQPETLAEQLKVRFPGLEIVGMRATPRRPLPLEENEQAIGAINQADPDVVWVGMGAPFQERWMAENRPRLNASVLVGVGAAFDIHTGRVRQAPHWMQQAGLEWLFRLAQEPHRLWRRYLLGNPRFVAGLIGQWLGIRRYEDS